MQNAISVLLAALICLVPLRAQAQEHTGVVRLIRIDASSNAAICAMTAPDMPGGAWACFYANRPHYLEMKEMLLRAFEAKSKCRFQWTQVSLTNEARIDVLTCSL
jgi:hypothetical protein